VRSTERSSNVSLLTCHTCVAVDVDKSRDFSLVDNKFSVLNPSKLFSVNHRSSSLQNIFCSFVSLTRYLIRDSSCNIDHFVVQLI